jgi:CheY-like chemotaxis protein
MNQIRNERRRKPGRILAVDDQPIHLTMLEALLAAGNYQVETAGNGFEALRRLKRSLPDLVVSDLRMPQMSGFELLSVIRKRFPHISTIAVSGEVTSGEISGLLTDLFLEKGTYSPAQLLASVRDLLDRSPLRQRLPAVARTLVCVPQTLTGNNGLTCNECLRFFVFGLHETDAGKPKWASCPYCQAELPYFVDPIPVMGETTSCSAA